MPEEMFPFDFAFGLRGGGVAEGHTLELEGLAQRGKGVGSSAEK